MALPVGPGGVAASLRRQPDRRGLAVFPWKPTLHWAIARLGLVIGEFFDFEELAADSAATGRYTGFFTAAPLHLRGGIGCAGECAGDPLGLVRLQPGRSFR